MIFLSHSSLRRIREKNLSYFQYFIINCNFCMWLILFKNLRLLFYINGPHGFQVPEKARRSGKLVTFRAPSLIFIRHQSISRATQNFFNQFSIYLYATGTIFSKLVFLLCATPNMFSQHESSFGCR